MKLPSCQTPQTPVSCRLPTEVTTISSLLADQFKGGHPPIVRLPAATGCRDRSVRSGASPRSAPARVYSPARVRAPPFGSSRSAPPFRRTEEKDVGSTSQRTSMVLAPLYWLVMVKANVPTKDMGIWAKDHGCHNRN